MSKKDGQNDTKVTEEGNVGGNWPKAPPSKGFDSGRRLSGELDRETTWRSRLDQTTTWGVTVVAVILAWAFSSTDNPHYVLLIGVFIVTLFLFIEARRYDYDVYRSRVRLFQQNLNYWRLGSSW